MAGPQQQSKRQKDDSSLRRPLVVRILRWCAIYWWQILLAAYLIILAANVTTLIVRDGAGSLLNGQHILDVLLVAPLYAFLSPRWWVVIPLVITGFVLWYVGEGAWVDRYHEPLKVLQNEWVKIRGLGAANVVTGLALQPSVVQKCFAVQPSPQGNVLALLPDGYSHTIHLVDSARGSIEKSITTSGSTTSLAWSPDGQLLAYGTFDGAIGIVETSTSKKLQTIQLPVTGTVKSVDGLAWTPDGHALVSCANDRCLRLSDPATGSLLESFSYLASRPGLVIWSPDGKYLVAGGERSSHGPITIFMYDHETKPRLTVSEEVMSALGDKLKNVGAAAWSPDGRLLAVGDRNGTVHICDLRAGGIVRTLEGHTQPVRAIAFSTDGRLLATCSSPMIGAFYAEAITKSDGLSAGSVRLWRCDTWEQTADIVIDPFEHGYRDQPPLAFIPGRPQLITRSDVGPGLHFWSFDIDALLQSASERPSLQYSNAKVVLVGESGVGKSGLGLVLSGHEFEPTESTHGRRVWTLAQESVPLDNRRTEVRDVLLWDLAGQPGYRLIHQLHLDEVTVAVVVIDGRSETDPFAGAQHWRRALNQAQFMAGGSALPLKTFLVAARTDRGGIGVSQERAKRVAQDLSFDGYFETSAKEGSGIEDLRAAILRAIEWEALPKASSTEIFQTIREFLSTEKSSGRVLASMSDLFRGLLRSGAVAQNVEGLRAQFETCIGLVESQNLIQRLSFGDLVLLQAEALDNYASALVNAIKSEPDGLGSIPEDRVKACDFFLPTGERLSDRASEQLLLIAMIEDLLRRELAFRVETTHGQLLVFPSQSTRTRPNLPNLEGTSVTFQFEGPLQNIYATLAVRLAYSELFTTKELWKDAITYSARAGGTCGMLLRILDEGAGELTLFSDTAASEQTRYDFEEFVAVHLRRWAIPQSLMRKRVFACAKCGEVFTSSMAQRRQELGFDWLDCPVCGARVSLLDREERLADMPKSQLSVMDAAANRFRDLHTAAVIVQGKRVVNDFDVFLCHNTRDKPAVRLLNQHLLEQGILPWLDELELRPGLPWQRTLEEQIENIKSAAVLVGESEIGPWQTMEMEAFLRQFVERGCPVMPVILPNCRSVPKLPVFLGGMTWIDLREEEPDPMERLIWGITGQRPPLPIAPHMARSIPA
jgi:WD40 repeat protein